MITHLEPDILECEVKWAVGSITTNKVSRGHRIPVELFQILKEMLVKCCAYHASKFGKLSSGHRTVFIPIPKKGNTKKCSNYCTVSLISHVSKVMLKILQARLHSTWTEKFQMFKRDFEKFIHFSLDFSRHLYTSTLYLVNCLSPYFLVLLLRFCVIFSFERYSFVSFS